MALFDYRLNHLHPIKECSSCEASMDYCCSERRCALLRKKFKEDLFTYCIENGILQNSFEPSNDNSNVANALQEPFIVEQDPEDIFCHQCTCELCGRGAHYGYNCPPKVPVVPDPKPFNNQIVDELPQTLPSFDPTCYSKYGNSFTYDSRSNLVHDSPNVFNPPLQPLTYLYEFCGNDAYYGHDCSLQVLFTYDPEPLYINTSNWDRPTICYDNDDDEDYAIVVTPSLSIEEPDNSLSMRDEHLDTVPETESDEFIKSSVESLDLSDFNDDSTSYDDDSFSIDNIEYVEASPPDSELVNSEVVEIVISEVGEIDDDILLTIKDDILQISSGSTTTHFDISLSEYEAFYDDHVKEISSGNTTTHFDSSLYDSFIFDLSINPFPPANRSDFYEFADELAHIISPS
nr:hypothetical protein [Tanacetum cinerariifolium]